MTTPAVYSEAVARVILVTAIRDARCSDLLNTLTAGGAVTLTPGRGSAVRLAFTTAEQLDALAYTAEADDA